MPIEDSQVRVRSRAPSEALLVMAERLRLGSIGIVAGLTSGLIAGILARLAMRIVALAIGRPPIFTSETDFILILGMSFGSALGFLYVVIQKHLAGSHRRRGLVFGAFLLLVFALLGFTDDVEFAQAPVLGVLLFWPLCLAFGPMLAVVANRLEHVFPYPRSLLALGTYGLVVGVGVVGSLFGVFIMSWAIVEAVLKLIARF